MSPEGYAADQSWIKSWVLDFIDIALVLALIYGVFLIIGERRTLWMLRGFILLMLAAGISHKLKLTFLSFVLEKFVLGSAVAMAVMFQPQFRRFLEQLGRGEIRQLFTSSRRSVTQPDSKIDTIVAAVKELSQNRTGALIVIETIPGMDEGVFSVPGVTLDGEISKELLQTIFQTSTLLHDGAVFIQGDRIAAAGAILPLSEEHTTSRQLGTRHRAAMGITERVANCLCIVVSEETGSISLASGGILNRPLTSTKLKELLSEKMSPAVDREVVLSYSITPPLSLLSRTISSQGKILLKRVFRRRASSSKKK